MKLLELEIHNVQGVDDGVYAFADASGNPQDRVLLEEDPGGVLLLTIAALLETLRGPAPTARDLAWWEARRGADEARIHARWALSQSEAARAGTSERAFSSHWRFGSSDEVLRELPVEGAPSAEARAELARYAFIDVGHSAVWMPPDPDPLAEMLARIARQDIATARSRRDSAAIPTISRAIAKVVPSLRLKLLIRPAVAAGAPRFACYRGRRRAALDQQEEVALDQLEEAERDAIHIAAALIRAPMLDGIVLVPRPERHVPREARARWLDWIADIAGNSNNQLFVAASPPPRPLIEAAGSRKGTP